jgi:16S rRNA processing protein RimM
LTRRDLIQIGKISGVLGLKGWLKIFSYTEPKNKILSYKYWQLKKGSQNKTLNTVGGQLHGKGVVAQLEGIADRDQAEALIGWEIYISHEQLPSLGHDEYYWADLVGLDVQNLEDVNLGKVDSLLETGANDVLIIKGNKERAIPFLQGQTVKSIDLSTGKMIVDWDADF